MHFKQHCILQSKFYNLLKRKQCNLDFNFFLNFETKISFRYLHRNEDTVAAAIKAGCNLELGTNVYNSSLNAMKQGKLTEHEIRENVKVNLIVKSSSHDVRVTAIISFRGMGCRIQCKCSHWGIVITTLNHSSYLWPQTNRNHSHNRPREQPFMNQSTRTPCFIFHFKFTKMIIFK